MKNQVNSATVYKQKAISISVLFAATIIIMFLGIIFSVFSLMNDISLKVLNTSVHGVFFGLIVFYLGIRYYFTVKKLKTEVYKNTSNFSWENFKKEKKH